MANKLNSMRFLEAQGIQYEVLTYDDSLHDASEVAQRIGVPEEVVYKTLVVERAAGGKPMLIMIPANRSLDLKKFAAAAGQKKLSMASHADAERLTGLKVGGISALALVHKNWEVYIDQSAAALDHIYISAGQRGTNLRVPVPALLHALKAKVVDAATANPT